MHKIGKITDALASFCDFLGFPIFVVSLFINF